jgi:hypothetical protein
MREGRFLAAREAHQVVAVAQDDGEGKRRGGNGVDGS